MDEWIGEQRGSGRSPAATLRLDRGRLSPHAGGKPAPLRGAGAPPHRPRRQPERGRHLQLEVRQLRPRLAALRHGRPRHPGPVGAHRLPHPAPLRHREPLRQPRRPTAAPPTSSTPPSPASTAPATGSTTTASTSSSASCAHSSPVVADAEASRSPRRPLSSPAGRIGRAHALMASRRRRYERRARRASHQQSKCPRQTPSGGWGARASRARSETIWKDRPAVSHSRGLFRQEQSHKR